MQDNSSVLIVLGVAILAAVLVIITSVRPDEATISPEQKALIAKHELMPGLTRSAAIDMIGTNLIHWKGSSWVVDLENCMGPSGSASLNSRMTPEMVISSWGEPDSTRESGIGLKYTYHQFPKGEIYVQFGRGKHAYAIFLDTALAPEYFKRRFPTWTYEICTLIATERVALGMTPEMARASWGIPSDINHLVNSGGVHDQWVYSSSGTHIHTKYLYFDNGKLTSWQD